MNTKEAIRRIKEHNRIHYKNEYPHAVLITEALNMAIKALEENNRLKELLKKAVEDIRLVQVDCDSEDCNYCIYDLHNCCKWKRHNEAMKLIGDDE